MRIAFHGAARNVTGSCHLIECQDKRILIDCGLYQGNRDMDEENRNDFGFDPATIDFLLLTHGHLDHTFSVIPLADGYGIPAYIHSEDRRALLHPEIVHGEEFIAALSGTTWSEPSQVLELKNNQKFEAVGLNITAIHAPGHTAGSLMFTVNDEILISGDVLFAGSIGRTDLPSGSKEAMERTLMTKILPLSDHLRVLPGHGPDTTIEYERRTNPYLKQLRS